MSTFRAEHSVRTHAFEVARPMAEAFRLFEPEGERAWAPGWNPRYVHPTHGTARAGMVFTTGEGAEATIWMVLRHEPSSGLVEYARITPASRTGIVLAQCAPIDAHHTRVTVTYTLTALSEEGNRMLREMDEAKYRDYIESWARAIEAMTGVAAG